MSPSKHRPIPVEAQLSRLQRKHAKSTTGLVERVERRLQRIIRHALLELAKFETRAGLDDVDRMPVDQAFLDDMNRKVAEALSGGERACRERFVEKLLVDVDWK